MMIMKRITSKGVMINSDQTWSDVTTTTNIMMERTITQSSSEKVTHLAHKICNKMNTKPEGSREAHIRTPVNKHTRSSDPRMSIHTLSDG